MAGDQIHLGIKVGYTLFLVILVPVYWAHYGPKNFLWFSDIALLTTGAALWLESPLLASMMMLAGCCPRSRGTWTSSAGCSPATGCSA